MAILDTAASATFFSRDILNSQKRTGKDSEKDSKDRARINSSKISNILLRHHLSFYHRDKGGIFCEEKAYARFHF
ncbi:hypothetical protein ACEQ6C_39995, partial [Rhizobium ruizarguesonis]